MADQADPKGLEALIRKGAVDTVLTVFPDGLGRLMGKRVVGRYFLDHVLGDGVHACIYLFTVDMEMEPLPGFTLTSWERGYGDMKMVPDLATWRLIPWLPQDRAGLLRRLHRGGRAHRGVAALGAQAADRADAQSAARRSRPPRSSSSTSSASPSTRRGPSATTA